MRMLRIKALLARLSGYSDILIHSRSFCYCLKTHYFATEFKTHYFSLSFPIVYRYMFLLVSFSKDGRDGNWDTAACGGLSMFWIANIQNHFHDNAAVGGKTWSVSIS